MRRWTGFALCCALLTLARPASAAYTVLNIPNRVDYAFGANNLLYVSTDGGSVLRYDTKTATYLTPFTPGGTLRAIDLSPDGTTLAVADAAVQTATNTSRVHLINTTTGVDTPLNFTLGTYERGTFAVAWGADGKLLTTSSFAGSGPAPFRRYDPSTGVTTKVRDLQQDTMLTPSADRQTIAFAEYNASNGPHGVYSVPNGAVQSQGSTGWDVYDVAVSRNGNRTLLPTFGGGFVYSRSGSTLTQAGKIGSYNDQGPLTGVFSPVADVLFTLNWGGDSTKYGVKAYDANTLALLATIDNSFAQSFNGGYALRDGRMEISPDGRLLAVSVGSGVRLYDVSSFIPEPSSAALLAAGAVAGLRRRRQA